MTTVAELDVICFPPFGIAYTAKMCTIRQKHLCFIWTLGSNKNVFETQEIGKLLQPREVRKQQFFFSAIILGDYTTQTITQWLKDNTGWDGVKETRKEMKDTDWCYRCHAEVWGTCVSAVCMSAWHSEKCSAGECWVIETEMFCLTPHTYTHTYARSRLTTFNTESSQDIHTTFIHPSGMRKASLENAAPFLILNTTMFSITYVQ